MNAAALIAELTELGIHLGRDGDRLYVEPPSDMDLAPYRPQIATAKRDILMELVKEEIMDCVHVEPEDFDRSRYDSLWREFYALEAQEEQQP